MDALQKVNNRQMRIDTPWRPGGIASQSSMDLARRQRLNQTPLNNAQGGAARGVNRRLVFDVS